MQYADLSDAILFVMVSRDWDDPSDAQTEILTRLRREELTAYAETYIVRRDTTWPDEGLLVRSSQAELCREHNFRLPGSFWIEASRERTINFDTGNAAFSARHFDADLSRPEDGKNTYVHVATGIYLPVQDVNAVYPVKLAGSAAVAARSIDQPATAGTTGTAKPRSQHYAVEDVVAHIEELGRAFVNETGRRWTRPELEEALPADNGAFPGISSTLVRKAWAAADLPAAWRVRGRRNSRELSGSN